MIAPVEDSQRDEIYKTHRDAIEDFAFDSKVTRVFPDMIRRSVPGYTTIVELIGVIVSQSIEPEALVYDLGCSRGAVTRATLSAVDTLPCTIHAIDASLPMIEQASADITDTRVKFRCEDIRETEIHDASAVVLNLVLQFVPPNQRMALLRRIFDGTQSGGLLVLTEKIKSTKHFEELHLKFKRVSGYSELEIQQKRAALEAVMQLHDLNHHRQRLRRIGYRRVSTWFRCLNWVSILAYK